MGREQVLEGGICMLLPLSPAEPHAYMISACCWSKAGVALGFPLYLDQPESVHPQCHTPPWNHHCLPLYPGSRGTISTWPECRVRQEIARGVTVDDSGGTGLNKKSREKEAGIGNQQREEWWNGRTGCWGERKMKAVVEKRVWSREQTRKRPEFRWAAWRDKLGLVG